MRILNFTRTRKAMNLFGEDVPEPRKRTAKPKAAQLDLFANQGVAGPAKGSSIPDQSAIGGVFDESHKVKRQPVARARQTRLEEMPNAKKPAGKGHDVSGEARDKSGKWTKGSGAAPEKPAATPKARAQKPAAVNFRDGKYWYRNTVRPVGDTTTPEGKGRVYDFESHHRTGNYAHTHGYVGYDKPLSAEDIHHFTMFPDIKGKSDPEIVAHFGMNPYRHSSPQEEHWAAMGKLKPNPVEIDPDWRSKLNKAQAFDDWAIEHELPTDSASLALFEALKKAAHDVSGEKRIPKGQPGGGRWTKGGIDEELEPGEQGHDIREGSFEYLEKHIDRINRMAVRLKVPPIRLRVLGHEMRAVKITDPDTRKQRTVYERITHVAIKGEQPTVGDWTMIGVLQHTPKGNLIREVKGAIVPKKYRRGDQKCDHCQTVRDRNETFLLQNAKGQVKQVGKSCLKEFTGMSQDPNALARWASQYADMDAELAKMGGHGAYDEGDEDGASFGRGRFLPSMNDFMACAAMSIRRFGYVTRAKADAEGSTTTGEDALNFLYMKNKEPEDVPTEKDFALAKRALDWIRKKPQKWAEESNYQHNLWLLGKNDYLADRMHGFAASIIMAYQKEKEREVLDAAAKRKAAKTGSAAPSGHLGTVGGKIEATVTVSGVRTIDSQYGTSYLCKFVDDDGNRLAWFASNPPDTVKEGARLRLAGTVKAHGEFAGVKETQLTRARVLGPAPAAEKPKAAPKAASKAPAAAPKRTTRSAPEIQPENPAWVAKFHAKLVSGVPAPSSRMHLASLTAGEGTKRAQPPIIGSIYRNPDMTIHVRFKGKSLPLALDWVKDFTDDGWGNRQLSEAGLKKVLGRSAPVKKSILVLLKAGTPKKPAPAAKPAAKAPVKAPAKLAAKRDVSAEPRIPKGQPHGGEWTKENLPNAYARPPKGVFELRVSEIKADPKRFQFKTAVDSTSGAGAELKSVQKWNPDLAGIMLVWRDPANGKTFVVNGHHRLDLAKRLRAGTVVVRYIDAPDAHRAMLIGAMVNIAEGRATPTDAARLLRSNRVSSKQMEQAGISLRGSLASQAAALSVLTDSIWNKVARGEMSEGRGAAIGRAFPKAAEQHALEKMLSLRKYRTLADSAIEELAKFVETAGRRTKTIETLFGEESLVENLAVEKAQLSASMKARLAGDRRLFGFVASAGRANRLATAGNKIEVEKNKEISDDAARIEAVYDKLSAYTGPISAALSRGAKRLAEGEPRSAILDDVYKEVRAGVEAELKGTQGAGRGDGARGASVPERPESQAAPAEPVDTETLDLFKGRRYFAFARGLAA